MRLYLSSTNKLKKIVRKNIPDNGLDFDKGLDKPNHI